MNSSKNDKVLHSQNQTHETPKKRAVVLHIPVTIAMVHTTYMLPDRSYMS